MIIDVNGKDLELKFNLKFMKKLNENYKKESERAGINIGINLLYAALRVYDPMAVVDTVRYAKVNNDVTNKEIEEWLDEADIEKLCDDFLKALETAPTTKGAVKIVKESIEHELMNQ